jgi:hypothetical protein
LRTIFIGHNRVEIDDASARTTLYDGKQIPAVPHDTESYRATAERLGYGSETGRMCVEHELLHTALACWFGLFESPVMRAVAEGDDPVGGITVLEEEAVMAVQAYAVAAGVNLTRRLAEVSACTSAAHS